MAEKKRVIWYIPEEKGGIRKYCEIFWPAVRERIEGAGFEPLWLDSPPVRSHSDVNQVVGRLRDLNPALIHIHHEFGIFGSRVPPYYRFPAFVRELRRQLPGTKLVATGHMVLTPESVLDWKGRGWQSPLRWFFNKAAMRWIRPSWMQGTWGELDGVVVHSESQERIIRESGCPEVRVIPLSVPRLAPVVPATVQGEPVVLVFGYFSPEKGQDVVIRAWSKLKSKARLVLAGGVRREEDRPYYEKCLALITELDLKSRIEITGFVRDEDVSAYYARARLTITPFRFTSGSASLTQGFGRAAPILASDIPLNRELNERVPGCLALFRTEDPDDCARQVDALLEDPGALKQLSLASKAYAELCAPEKMAEVHAGFYGELLK